MFIPNWVGIFDDPLMPKRRRGEKGWGSRGGGGVKGYLQKL